MPSLGRRRVFLLATDRPANGRQRCRDDVDQAIARNAPNRDDERAGHQHDQNVALYLNVSVPQVYALVRSGVLPAIKIGGRGIWRVDRHQLEAYIERLHRETEEWAKAHPLNPRQQL